MSSKLNIALYNMCHLPLLRKKSLKDDKANLMHNPIYQNPVF